MRTSVIFVVVVALMSAACGAFDSGLESELKALKAETANNAGDAEALYDKAKAFVEKVEQYEDPPEGLMKEAREFQLQRGAEWALVAGTDTAKKALEKARALFSKWGDKIPTEEEKKAEEEKENKSAPLTEEEKRAEEEYKRNADPTSDTIPASGKPKEK